MVVFIKVQVGSKIHQVCNDNSSINRRAYQVSSDLQKLADGVKESSRPLPCL
eukprot:CAMPEP_0168792888 /NCGR_PEP_ID=MMETSP0725-20121227/14773_1 /TAXON_ID=265536 /ORGANISM="Amphiprora sp., Strain CCMP467" /LENGTH=51 /DNA_ID=CAMNT_0008843589 /DNA_START=142 /DNA_END=293 /DNA_ORIENTATION=+